MKSEQQKRIEAVQRAANYHWSNAKVVRTTSGKAFADTIKQWDRARVAHIKYMEDTFNV